MILLSSPFSKKQPKKVAAKNSSPKKTTAVKSETKYKSAEYVKDSGSSEEEEEEEEMETAPPSRPLATGTDFVRHVANLHVHIVHNCGSCRYIVNEHYSIYN